MNLIANGLKENKTPISRFFADIDAMTTRMVRTFHLGATIPVTSKGEATPITVQLKEDGIVTHCNHAGAYYGLYFSDVFFKDEITEVPHEAMLCDKCHAWQDKEGNWNE